MIQEKPQPEMLDKSLILIELFQEPKLPQELLIWIQLIYQELPLNGSGISKLQLVHGDLFTMLSICVIITDHTRELH
jgi:hypothetical protein